MKNNTFYYFIFVVKRLRFDFNKGISNYCNKTFYNKKIFRLLEIKKNVILL